MFMTEGTDFSQFPLIKELSDLHAWVDQVTLRGFSMSPLLLVGDELGCMSSAEVGILGGRISGEFQPQIMVLG